MNATKKGIKLGNKIVVTEKSFEVVEDLYNNRHESRKSHKKHKGMP